MKLTQRKTRLVLETPLEVFGRPLIAHVEAWGLALRLKKRRYTLSISWAQIFNRASEIEADRRRAERREKP